MEVVVGLSIVINARIAPLHRQFIPCRESPLPHFQPQLETESPVEMLIPPDAWLRERGVVQFLLRGFSHRHRDGIPATHLVVKCVSDVRPQGERKLRLPFQREKHLRHQGDIEAGFHLPTLVGLEP